MAGGSCSFTCCPGHRASRLKRGERFRHDGLQRGLSPGPLLAGSAASQRLKGRLQARLLHGPVSSFGTLGMPAIWLQAV